MNKQASIRVLILGVFVLLCCSFGAVQGFADDALSCPKCERHYKKQPRYCPKDGVRLKQVLIPKKACPNCGLVFANGENFCPTDGFKLKVHEPIARSCKKCDRIFSGGEVFCPFDGQSLGASHAGLPKIAVKPITVPKEPIQLENPPNRVEKLKPTPRMTKQLVKKFAASGKNTAVLPFQMSKGGRVNVTVEFAGDSKILVLLYAPGFVKAVAKKEGLSPVKLEVSIDSATAALNKDFELWVVHRDGAEVFGKVTFDLPFSGFAKELPSPDDAIKKTAQTINPKASIKKEKNPAPKAKGSRSKDRFAFELNKAGTFSKTIEVKGSGRLDLKAEFEGKGNIIVFLQNPETRVRLIEKRGSSPLQLFYQVTGKKRSFRLWVVDFDGKQLKGHVTITQP
jgi:RNA polymerase subunit RPABC4/transcription elongation factor Spt4